MKLILPSWLYGKMVEKRGQEQADEIMRLHDAEAVDDWPEVSGESLPPGDPEQ